MITGAYTGSLYYWRVPGAFAEGVRVKREVLRFEGWSRWTLSSPVPLAQENPAETSLFLYDFFVRESGSHFLLASHHGELIPHFLKTIGVETSVAPPLVDVPTLTRDLVDRPGAYSLGAVFARVDGFGLSLRTMIFYGTDLGEAKLFVDLLPILTPFRAQLRDVRLGIETLSIASRGEISFFFRDLTSLRHIDRSLRYLTRRDLITWPDESSGQEGDPVL